MGNAQEFSCADCTPETAGAAETFFEEHGDEVVTTVLRVLARYETQPLEADDAWGNLLEWREAAGNTCTGPKWGVQA